jgi:acid phosphatase (class A)
LGGTPRLPTGYPSGGTVMTQMTAILLSKMIPEKRPDLHESSREWNLTRIMIGEHFPRDIRAGEIAGTVIAHALMQVPAFMRDFEPARVELRQVLGYPPEPDAVGSVQAK